ncbi:Protein kinase-like domain containing protein [Elaphomyces granulatus]
MDSQIEMVGMDPRIGFYNIMIGEVLNNQYIVLRQLGSGLYSSVWLARDLCDLSYKAVKVLSAECYDGTKDLFEKEILNHLRDKDPSHPGYKHISILRDSFVLRGPYGHHVCLVFDPMGETLSSFGTLFIGCRIPGRIVQRFTKQLLLALDYAHASRVIHTDIHQGNIMIKIRDYSVIDEYLDKTANDTGIFDPIRPGVQCRWAPRDFGVTDMLELETLDIALCDWGTASWVHNHLSEIIQPVLLRAPEVLLGAPWGPGVDIWNLGAVLFEVLEAGRLCNGEEEVTDFKYSVKNHLAQMEALFGYFPGYLLACSYPPLIYQCFDKHGQIGHPIQGKLESRLRSLCGDDKAKFISMFRSMMTIDPACRKSAHDLLITEPWLRDRRMSLWGLEGRYV